MAKKLLEKAGLIHLPPALPSALAADAGAAAGAAPGGASPGVGLLRPAATSGDPSGAADAEAGRPKTAPGSMLQFMTAQSAAVREAESLRERLAGFEGALPVRRLDPHSVRASAWANRHEDSYRDAAFLALQAEIAAAGGNVQAIKVRPLAAAGPGVGPSNAPGGRALAGGGAGARYEIVFGHRRHRACLALGLPVLAMVEDLPEQQMFVQMERENRSRKDLSAWEQGTMYARALDQGLYPSNRQLASAIGRDLGDIGKALSLARLPLAVVQAFASPLDLQYRWAKPLGDAQQRDPEGLVLRARALKAQADKLGPKQIFDALVGAEPAQRGAAARADITVRVAGKVVAVVSADAQGHTQVRFTKVLKTEQRQALAVALEQFLAEQGRAGQA